MATTITRATLTDSTSAITGDIMNAAWVGTTVYDRVDQLVAADIQFGGTIKERNRTLAIGEWANYTPTWTASGTPPSLGNGNIYGRYTKIGKTVHVKIMLSWGSTTSSTGSAAWTFSTPSTMAVNSYAQGMCAVGDASPVAHYVGYVIEGSSTTLVCRIHGTASNIQSTNVPITWTTSDALWITATYEEA